jgi:hypothetical protein
MLLTHNHVLNPDSELSVLVVAWLIRNAHALKERSFVYTVNTTWPFVNVKEMAHSMASAMLVVKTNRPKCFAGKNIHVRSRDTAISWPHKSFKLYHPHQNPGVAILLELCRDLTTEVSGSCDVSSSIEVLASRVKQVYFIVV